MTTSYKCKICESESNKFCFLRQKRIGHIRTNTVNKTNCFVPKVFHIV